MRRRCALFIATVGSTFAVACAAVPLEGTSWRASAIDGRGAAGALVPETEITMAFGADGRVAGTAGCNRYTARYVAHGATLRIEAPALTRMACLRPGVMEQEGAFVDALASVTTARVDGSRLELRREDGTLAVTLQRAADAQ
jgi:heat shock protein HslJ